MRRTPPIEGDAPKLVLVDAHGYLHRAFHALPPLTTSKGEPVGALLGFARVLLKIKREVKPAYLAVCYDAPGPTFRDKIAPDYKATRPPLDEALRPQLALAPEVAEALGFNGLTAPGWEADDLLATLARKGREKGLEVVLVTSDKDAAQLVGEHVRILKPEGDWPTWGPAEVEAKYGLPPSALVDYFALVGDSVDNVKGAEGVGPVTAVKLLKKYGSLASLFKALDADPKAFTPALQKNLKAFQGRSATALKLIRLAQEAETGAEVDSFRAGPPDEAKLVPLFQRLEFSKLLQEALGAESGAGAVRTPGPAAPAKPIAAAAWLKKARTEPLFAYAVRACEEGDGELLPSSSILVGLALPDGSSACASSLPQAAPMLESVKTKAAHDVKAGLAALRAHGARPAGPYFDTALAAYLLNPSKAKYGLAETVLEHLGEAAVPGAGPEGAAAEARLVMRLAARLEPELKARGLDRLYRELELPLMEVLARMEADGVAVNRAYLEDLSREFEDRIAALKLDLNRLAGQEVNLHSPKQLAQLLFETLKLPVQRKNKTGYSTDEETLTALAELHPFPGKLLEYREWAKLKSTYIDNLLAQADGAGRVHTRFNQFGSATGRLASVQPNLQNIPIRSATGMRIRRAFVPREGWVFLSADYSQIDLRVLAHVTGDEALVRAFREGEDVHAQTACDIFGVTADKVDKEMRRRAKAVNFGIVYGQGPHGLSQTLGVPFPEAQGYIKRYFERYKGVKAWIDAHLAEARKEGLVRTFTGRLRYLPELNGAGPMRSFAERAAVNTPIQGGSSDVIKAAMLAIARGLEAGRPARFKARMLLQVHDDLLLEAPPEELGPLSEWVKSEMEGAVKLKVPLVVDLKTGPNWADMEPLAELAKGGRK